MEAAPRELQDRVVGIEGDGLGITLDGGLHPLPQRHGLGLGLGRLLALRQLLRPDPGRLERLAGRLGLGQGVLQVEQGVPVRRSPPGRIGIHGPGQPYDRPGGRGVQVGLFGTGKGQRTGHQDPHPGLGMLAGAQTDKGHGKFDLEAFGRGRRSPGRPPGRNRHGRPAPPVAPGLDPWKPEEAVRAVVELAVVSGGGGGPHPIRIQQQVEGLAAREGEGAVAGDIERMRVMLQVDRHRRTGLPERVLPLVGEDAAVDRRARSRGDLDRTWRCGRLLLPGAGSRSRQKGREEDPPHGDSFTAISTRYSPVFCWPLLLQPTARNSVPSRSIGSW